MSRANYVDVCVTLLIKRVLGFALSREEGNSLLPKPTTIVKKLHAAIWYLFPVTHHNSSPSLTVIPVFSCAGKKLELLRQYNLQSIDYRLDDPRFKSWLGQDIFLSSKISRLCLEPCSLLFNGYWGSSTAQVKNEWSKTSCPVVCFHSMKMDNISFYFYLLVVLETLVLFAN